MTIFVLSILFVISIKYLQLFRFVWLWAFQHLIAFGRRMFIVSIVARKYLVHHCYMAIKCSLISIKHDFVKNERHCKVRDITRIASIYIVSSLSSGIFLESSYNGLTFGRFSRLMMMCTMCVLVCVCVAVLNIVKLAPEKLHSKIHDN